MPMFTADTQPWVIATLVIGLITALIGGLCYLATLGWTYAWGGKIEDPYPEHRTFRQLGFSVERRDNAVWITLSLWLWAFSFRRLDGVNRETGPEDNAAVIGYFFRGRERRSKSRAFRSGFAEAAAKGPVPTWRKSNRERVDEL